MNEPADNALYDNPDLAKFYALPNKWDVDFDSRNPDFAEPKARNLKGNRRNFDHPELGQIELRNRSNYNDDTNILTYANGYIVVATSKEYFETAQIRYTRQLELAEMIENAGLTVNKWLCDWQGTQFHDEAREIIPVGGLG